MSLASIQQAYIDMQLRARVDAAVLKEAFYRGPDDAYARQIIEQSLFVNPAFYWRVAVDSEVAYEAALQAGRGAPGHDTDVITDGAITAAVGVAWPVIEEPES